MKRISIYFFCVVAIGCITSGILYWESGKSNEIKVEKSERRNETVSDETTAKEVALQEATPTFEKQAAKKRDQETNHAMLESDVSENRFLVKEEHGFLVIYDAYDLQVYDETTIRVTDLPEVLQLKLQEGIFFTDEQALYAFLESYSS